MSSVVVIIRSHDIREGSLRKGILMYPCDRGKFKSAESKLEYEELFEDTAPPMPYYGVGKRYGETVFTEEELRAAKLEHMKSHFSSPKQEDELFWSAEEKAFKNLVFPLSVIRENCMNNENATTCAVRMLWEYTGLRVDRGELKRLCGTAEPAAADSTHVFQIACSLNRAKYEWMNHQAERLTLTDWRKCSHAGVLDNLGIARVVKRAYCTTHGGPVLVSNVDEHIIEKESLQILEKFHVHLS